jgi:hypothetical protein
MAPVRGTSARLLIDEFDFSGATNSINVTKNATVLNPTNLASTGVEKQAGLPDGSIEHGGFWNGAGAGYIQDELQDRLGGGGSVYVAVTYGAAGAPADVLPTTWGQQLTITAPVNDLITVGGTWPANGNFRSGLLVYRGTISQTGTQTYVDFGAQGTGGGFAYLFVQDITGSATDATITVQSDDNTGFSTPATEGTFEFSAVGVVAVALSGTVDRYVRINVTDLGGADDFTVVCIVGLSGVTF